MKLNPNYACLRHPQPRRSLFGSSAAAIPVIERAIRSAHVSADQYEALHDGHEVQGLQYAPRREFVISHVGKAYEPALQDLGVEYYQYVG